MNPNRPLITMLLIFTFLFLSIPSHAQTSTNFAGKWIFDKTKSSADLLESTYEGTVVMQITQNSATIAFSDTWSKPGEKDFKTSADTYYLDGKERVTKHDIGTERRTATWSQDRKVLTIANRDTQKLKGVPQDFLVTDTYTLSDNGRILTIDRYSRNPVKGESNAKKVYSRK